MVERKIFAIVDTNNIAHRAILNLTAKDGMPVGVLFFLIRLLRAICLQKKPDYITFFFDAPHDSYESDKEKNFYLQLERFREFLDIIFINYIVAAKGVPADYYIASLVNWLKKNADVVVYLYSNDHDFLQLVNEKVYVIRSGKREEVYDKEKIIEKYGMEPEQLLDYWALVGDKADEIKGVRGIGEKRGKELIEKYGDLFGALTFLETQEKFKGCTNDAWEAYNQINLQDKNLEFLDRYPCSCLHLYENVFDVKRLGDFFRRYNFSYFYQHLQSGLLFKKPEKVEGESRRLVE